MVTLKIDTDQMRNALNRLSVYQRKDLPTLVQQSARRVAVNLSRGTAPFGFNLGAKTKVDKAIVGDVFKVFDSVPSVAGRMDEERRKQFAFLEANRSPAVVSQFLRENGIDLRYSKSATVGEMKKTQGGRKRQPRNQRPRVVAPLERVSKLLEKLQRRVGLAKHGWALCARRLGGTRGIPAWVTRSKGRPQAGSVSVTQLAGSTSVAMTNHVPYISSLTSNQTMRRAMQREADFLTNQVSRELERRFR
jgi:hypothetical protein